MTGQFTALPPAAKRVPRRVVQNALERLVSALARRHRSTPLPPQAPTSIFVLRNNDIGDVIIITPLFEALRRTFPDARIVAGVGAWSAEILENNPHVTEVLRIAAPWNNKFLVPAPGGARAYLRQQFAAARYLLFSPEVVDLRARGFDVGIDVLGSIWGALLMLRAEIPYRMGVKGYQGGHTGAQAVVPYDPKIQVGRAAMAFAELLGARSLPPTRPQIFLTEGERRAGEGRWADAADTRGVAPIRVVIAPGGGLPAKCWPAENYAELVQRLSAKWPLSILVVGAQRDTAAGDRIAQGAPARNLAGQLSLRETFALVASADLVLCNASMMMHAAAAFDIPTFVFLTDAFGSAEEHDAQWGHLHCRSLGKGPGRARPYTAEEGYAEIDRALATRRASSAATSRS